MVLQNDLVFIYLLPLKSPQLKVFSCVVESPSAENIVTLLSLNHISASASVMYHTTQAAQSQFASQISDIHPKSCYVE
jgi:hypothetical protein